MTAAQVLALQRSAGNASVTRLIQRQALASPARLSAGGQRVMDAIDAATDSAAVLEIVEELRAARRRLPVGRTEPVDLLIGGPVQVPSYEIVPLLAHAELAAGIQSGPAGPGDATASSAGALAGGAPSPGDLAAVRERLAQAEALVRDETNGLSAEQRAALHGEITRARSALARYQEISAAGQARSAAMGGIGVAAGVVVADDATVVGVADDWLLPLLGIAALATLLVTRSPASDAELQRAWQDVVSPLRQIGEIGIGISLAVQGPRLVGQTENVARHLARLLALGAVAGVPSGEPPKRGDDDDKHWWSEIKGSLRQIAQAIKGASRKQVMRELRRRFTDQQIAEIERLLAEAARHMGEGPPPFLPP